MADWPTLQAPSKVAAYSGNCQAAGSTDTKGSYKELTSGTTEGGFLTLCLNTAYRTCAYLVDVAIGASGSEQIILSNLYAVNHGNYDFTSHSFYTGLYIPAGSRLALRCQCSLASKWLDACAVINGFGFSPEGYQKAETLGADTSNSNGTVVDPGATKDTKGSWVQFSSGTTIAAKHLIFMPGANDNWARRYVAFKVDIGLTASPGDAIIVPDLALYQNSYTMPGPPYAFPLDIPIGSEVHVRAEANNTDAADRKFDAVIVLVG